MDANLRKVLATAKVIMGSTEVDKHGDQLTLKDLEEMCEQINAGPPKPGYIEHDASSRPVWQVIRAWIEEKDSEPLLCGEVEVWDQDTLDKINSGKLAVSMGYTKNHSNAIAGDAPVLRVDPNTFNRDELKLVLEDWHKAGIGIASEEYFRKAELPPAQLMLDASKVSIFIGGALAGGFIGFFGNHLAEKLCQGLAKLFKSAKGNYPAFIMRFDEVVDGRRIVINFTIPYTNEGEFLNGYLVVKEELERLPMRKLQPGTQAIYFKYVQGEHKWEIVESRY